MFVQSQQKGKRKHDKHFYLLTSSADCAMKKPTVLEGSFVPLGLIEILLSFPSSLLTSMASNSSFNFTKHNLEMNIKD